VIAANRGNFILGAVIGVSKTVLRVLEEVHEPSRHEDGWRCALGASPTMQRLFALLPRIAASDSTVLIEGETGTGKTMLAEAIHEAGPRAARPFVVVDCSAIPPSLIESELFGHEKGAFTGAHTARFGAFEAANKGTIFLDEIGELPLDMQPKLMRALEYRAVKRIGSTSPVCLDVRVVAATNRNLREMVKRGSFRSDLYYRLNTVRLHVPPLRERREDIPLLIAHFHQQFVPEGGPAPAELLEALSQQDWPGNVRELRSSVERAVLLGDPTLWKDLNEGAARPRSPDSDGAPDTFDESLSFRLAKERAMARWERWFVGELVHRNDGNLSQAARQARMDRNHLRELLRRHRVSARDD
jgi:DNA-binding NtrC family response regulator